MDENMVIAQNQGWGFIFLTGTGFEKFEKGDRDWVSNNLFPGPGPGLRNEGFVNKTKVCHVMSSVILRSFTH